MGALVTPAGVESSSAEGEKGVRVWSWGEW